MLHVVVFLISIIVCRLYKLTLSDQPQFTLGLTVRAGQGIFFLLHINRNLA